jgi:hypothetical protein
MHACITNAPHSSCFRSLHDDTRSAACPKKHNATTPHSFHMIATRLRHLFLAPSSYALAALTRTALVFRRRNSMSDKPPQQNTEPGTPPVVSKSQLEAVDPHKKIELRNQVRGGNARMVPQCQPQRCGVLVLVAAGSRCAVATRCSLHGMFLDDAGGSNLASCAAVAAAPHTHTHTQTHTHPRPHPHPHTPPHRPTPTHRSCGSRRSAASSRG